MKKVLSIITVLTMLLACIYVPAAAADLGSYENPYRVTANSLTPTKITLPPDSGSIYVFVDNSDNTVLTVGEATNNLYQLYYCRQPVTIENDGTTSFTMVAEAGFFVLMNPTDSQIVVSMRLEGGSAPQPIGTVDKPEELSPVASGDGFAISKTQALADGNEGYYYSLSAPCNGTMNVKISAQGSAGTPIQWSYVINNISAAKYGERTISEAGAAETNADIPVSTGNNITVHVATYDPANEWHNPAGTVNVAITFIPEQSDDTSGGGSDGNGGSTAPEVNYVISDTRLTKGTKSYPISKDKDYTVFIFSPEEIGKYTISTFNASMGIVSTNGVSVTTTPSAESVCVGSLEWTCTGAGQSVWVAVRSRSDAAEITVEGENLQTNDSTKEYYENKHVPSPFTFSGNAAALTYVNTKDASVDKAVLGDDGFYHLNSADGPILYADLDDSRISIEEANSYGQLKHFEYEGEKLVKTVDYSLAMTSYIENMDKSTGLYPLTEDLMEVFSKVGTGNGWYGADGWVGGELEDSWMFACCYQGEGNDSSSGNDTTSNPDDTTSPEDTGSSDNDGSPEDGGSDDNGSSNNENVSGNAGGNGGSDNNSGSADDEGNNEGNGNNNNNGTGNEGVTAPQTGDEMIYIAIVAIAAIGAFILLTAIRRRRFNK